ncbi:MAG: metallophosphoesterase family protein [Mariprofundaceae bacterium]|nr:metallophosphoesterase family protein [Mariprofundaceae bacterium]
MKIQLLSDLHLEHASCDVSAHHADVVVLAGDIGVGLEGLLWAKEVFDVPVIYVAGNHEYHDATLSMQEHQVMMQHATQHSHVHF